MNALEKRIINRYNSISALSRFNGCILAAKDTDILAAVNLGFADYTQGTPFTGDTIFYIASLSKMFTSACILLLKEQGKLKLTDSVSVYFPDYKNGANVTVKQLLGHMSGIPNFNGIPAFWDMGDKIQLPNDIYEFIKGMDLEWEPGSKYDYSNTNYILLGLIIEKLSGKSYSDFLAEHIFAPLDMKHSGHIPQTSDIPYIATGYDTLCPQPLASEKVNPVIPFAAGGIHSCVNDLFKWSVGLFNGRILTQESLNEMLNVDRGDYGLGVRIEKLEIGGKSYTTAGHAGLIPGYGAKFARILETRHTLILLSNATDIPADLECFSELIDCITE